LARPAPAAAGFVVRVGIILLSNQKRAIDVVTMTAKQPLTQTKGQKVMFWLDGRHVVGEILRSTPSTQTVYCDNRNYAVHHTKLTPVFFSEALGRFVTIPE
jgi:hypothetical protein